MENEYIIKSIFATVGLVQIIKNLIGKGSARLWIFVTILCGIGIGCSVIFLPNHIIDGLLIVCGATLFYDTIYKAFEKFIKILADKLTGTTEEK